MGKLLDFRSARRFDDVVSINLDEVSSITRYQRPGLDMTDCSSIYMKNGVVHEIIGAPSTVAQKIREAQNGHPAHI